MSVRGRVRLGMCHLDSTSYFQIKIWWFKLVVCNVAGDTMPLPLLCFRLLRLGLAVVIVMCQLCVHTGLDFNG